MVSKRLDDGFPTFMSFSLLSSVKFWEKEVTPGGLDAGGPNDTTTMRNVKYRTHSPKKLVTVAQMSFAAAYDPAVIDSIKNTLLGANQLITIHFSDGSTLAFWGWLDKFMMQRTVEGSQPVADVTIEPSNHDNTSPLPLEVAPVFTAAA